MRERFSQDGGVARGELRATLCENPVPLIRYYGLRRRELGRVAGEIVGGRGGYFRSVRKFPLGLEDEGGVAATVRRHALLADKLLALVLGVGAKL